MIRVWALPLAVLCALQCSVSAEPRPDFALHRPLYGTAKVTGAVGELDEAADDLTEHLSLTLNSNYPGLSAVLSAVTELGQTLDGKLESVLNPLRSLAQADSASAYDLFGTTQAALADLLGYVREGYESLFEGLRLVHQPLPSQFDEALDRVADGLEELRHALDDLSDYVEAALSGSSEESGCRHRGVPPRLVYRVAYAVRHLRAYLPLVSYLLRTTVANLRRADEYLVRLETQTDVVLNVQQYVALADANLLPLASSVNSAVLHVQGELSTVLGRVAALSNVQSVSSYPQLLSALSAFGAVLGGLPAATSSFYQALYNVGDRLEYLLLHPATTVPTLDNAEVVRELVATLLSNGPFASYCFCKYSELLLEFADLGLTGVEECVDREGERMRHYKRTMLQQVEQLRFDFQDVPRQLRVCDDINNRNRRNNCVRALAVVYSALAGDFQTKFNAVFTDGVAEATASKHRLEACVTALQFRLVDETTDELKRGIRKCARHGPYCTHEESHSGELDELA